MYEQQKCIADTLDASWTLSRQNENIICASIYS